MVKMEPPLEWCALSESLTPAERGSHVMRRTGAENNTWESRLRCAPKKLSRRQQERSTITQGGTQTIESSELEFGTSLCLVTVAGLSPSIQ